MSLSLNQLIKHVGMANIRVQPLAPCNAKLLKDGWTKLTFETDQLNPTNVMKGDGPFGLILWIPRDKLPKT